MGRGKKKNNLFWQTSRMNDMVHRFYYDQLMELSMVMFEWQNLPDTVDPRYLELVLFGEGKAVFFKDDVLGHLALRCAANGSFDVVGTPLQRRAHGYNGYNMPLDENNSVLIWNNYLHGDSRRAVDIYAARLAEIDRTTDVNITAQKTPVVIQCTETQRLTMLNLYDQYKGNQPFIFGDKNLDLNGVKVFNTAAPYVADKLMQAKSMVWNEALTYLGISNTNITKRERLISDEVLRSQGGTIASRYSRLEMRRQACDKINDMFGLNISCDYREDYREIISDMVRNDDTTDESMSDKKEGA